MKLVAAVIGGMCLATAAMLAARTEQSASAGTQRVALTFDDLPDHGPLPPGLSRVDVAKSILGTLKAHHAPAVYGFINAKGIRDFPDTAEFLDIWHAAGHPLGNHTFSHMDLHTNSVEAFEQDTLARVMEARSRQRKHSALTRRDWPPAPVTTGRR